MAQIELEPLNENSPRENNGWFLKFLLPLKKRYNIFKLKNGYADYLIERPKKDNKSYQGSRASIPSFSTNVIVTIKEILDNVNSYLALVDLLATDKILGSKNELWIITKENKIDINNVVNNIIEDFKINIIELAENEKI